ncbi:hypothetical protein ACFYWN_42870 [Streptomyces sp. NPDC002917]|uniref:hypothetical protein n=1 Tax=Streptomyces sp. NPDC002917 TaxID=3364671 RepID=UPI00367EA440
MDATEIPAAVGVCCFGHFIQGCEVAAFEDDFLWLSILTLGIVTSDQVIVESFTFAARAVTVTLAGVAPAFADRT